MAPSKKSNTPATLPAIEQWPPVIVLGGTDTLGREKVKEQIHDALYATHPTFQEEYYDSTRESLDEYLVRLVTPTIFGDFRLFHVPHVQKLSLVDTERLAEILPVVGNDVLLLLEYEPKKRGSDKRSLTKELSLSKHEKSGLCFHYVFDAPRAYQLPKWLVGQVKTLFGRRMDEVCAKYLVEYVGDDVSLLYSEIQKLDIYLPENAPITKQAIEAVTGNTANASPYDLANAIGQRSWSEVLEILERIFDNKTFQILPMVAIIYRHFWKLYKIRSYAQANARYAMSYFSAVYKEKSEIAASIGKAVGIMGENQSSNQAYPIMVLPDMIGQARGFQQEEIQKALTLLSDYDRSVKSGLVRSDDASFTQLCYTLTRLGKVEM